MILVFVGIGLLLVIPQLNGMIRAIAARTWHSTTGSIICSNVAADPYGGDKWIHYSPVITYEYVVNGITYRGSRISLTGHGIRNTYFGASLQSRTELRTGRRVMVWYDPAEPSRATLIRTFGAVAPTLALLGLWFLLVAVGAVLLR